MIVFKSELKEFLKKIFNIPGIPELYLWFSNITKRPFIYDCCWWYLPEWLKELRKNEEMTEKTHRNKVLVFSTLPYWINYSMALSVVLLGRNVDVDFAWIIHPEIIKGKSILGYKHWLRIFKSNRHRYKYQGLNIINLKEMQSSIITDEMIEIARKQSLIDVSYLLKKEQVHIETDPADKKTFKLRMSQNLESVSRLATLINSKKYDRVIMPNGVSLDFGAAFSFLTSCGLPVSTIEMWDLSGKVVVSDDSPVVQINTDKFWKQDQPHILSETAKMRVQKIIETRKQPASKDLTILYQRVKLESEEQIRVQLRLTENKPVVLICPNVPFDSIFYVERKKNFDSMKEWLIKTVEFFFERMDCQVVIRCHPAEIHHEASETTENIINEVFPQLPEHFRIIQPKALINTYSIMEIADIGIVYASTTGLEMAMRGIPVVCGISNQHYNKKGFTFDPETPEIYYIKIDEILQEPSKYRLSERAVELAWCYADIYFNVWPLSFPWHVTTLEKDLNEWPIIRMLTSEGEEKFGAVFNTLCKSII